MTSHATRAVRLLLAAAVTLGGIGMAAAGPEKAAVFDFQFAKGSAAALTDEDRTRLARTSAALRDLLVESGRYTIVSTEPLKAEIAKGSDLRACNGCAEDYARRLGADAAITGEVQKVSTLILNLNVYVKDLKAGTPERAYSVDMRGDTDESFARAIRYLVKNRLLADPAP